MPHIVLEYSENLAALVKESGVLGKLHRLVAGYGLFAPEAVKSRAIAYSEYMLAEGATSFAHVTLSILSGRSEEQRSTLNEQMFQTLKTALPSADKLSCNLHEMNAVTYRKAG